MKFTPIKDRIEYGGALIGKEERNAILKVLDSQGGKRWTIGPESEAFEKELAKEVGVAGSVVVNSGSSALLVAISALKLPKGSKVIIPALNFPTAYSSLLQNGLVPVVVDCELNTLNIDAWEVDKALRQHPDVKAVIAINIAGNCVDMELLSQIVDDYHPNIKIILDNCDGLGGKLGGVYIEKYADVSCVSFHAAHIITMGEGGAVLSNNPDILSRARKMREWGRASGSDTLTKHAGFPPDYRERYVFDEIGYNVKPLELQCAMGRIQLKKLNAFKKARKKNYDSLRKIFSKFPSVKLMDTTMGADPCWFSFPLLVENRPEVMAFFEANNVETRTIFSGNILKHPAYKNTEHIQIGTLDNSNYVMEHGMFLSVHPSLTPEMLKFIEVLAKEICS